MSDSSKALLSSLAIALLVGAVVKGGEDGLLFVGLILATVAAAAIAWLAFFVIVPRFVRAIGRAWRDE